MKFLGRMPGPAGRYGKAGAAAIVLFFCFSLFPHSACFSGTVKSVEGIVQRVDGPRIQVRGKEYNTSGVPLTSPSGKNLTGTVPAVGKKVEMLFTGGILKSIVIHEDMVE